MSDRSALAHRVVELERLLGINDPTLQGVFRLSNRCANLLGLLLRNEYVPRALVAEDVGSLRMTVKRLRHQMVRSGIAVQTRRGVGYFLTPGDKLKIRVALQYAGQQIPLPLHPLELK